MAHHKSHEDQTVKYESIDEKTFIQRFVTPYASYMCYNNGKYWHKNGDTQFHPVFNFSVSTDVDSTPPDDSQMQRVPDWEDENKSFLIALDGQVYGELGHYLYIGFGHLHAGRLFLYPVGPIGINYRDGAFPDTTIDSGFDNCIPMPLQIKHYYSDGFYTSNTFQMIYYHRGVLQKREAAGRFWYYRGGQLDKYEGDDGEIRFEQGFTSKNISCRNAAVSDFYRGERHGDMISKNCRARLDNGYLYGSFYYESSDWRESDFPPPHKGRLEGKVSVVGNFHPGIVKVSYNNLWDNYCGTTIDDPVIGFVKRKHNITLSPHHCLGSLKLFIDGIEQASFYLNADGQFHGLQRPLLGAKVEYYWNGKKYTCDKYNEAIAEMKNYTSMPRELIDIIILYC